MTVAPAGTKPCRTEIRPALGMGFDLGLKSLVLPAADVLEVGAFGTCCRRFIQIDRDIELAAHALPHPPGDGDAFLHCRFRERDEGTDVRRADARMLAGVLVQVDQLGRGLDGAEGRLLHRRKPDLQG